MALVENKDLVEEYFEEVKDKYGISFERFSAICRAPFIFFKKTMAEVDFPRINVKYFGKFVVWPGSAKNIIKLMDVFLSSGRITQEQYDERTVNLKTYISNYECDDDEDQTPPDSQREETPS